MLLILTFLLIVGLVISLLIGSRKIRTLRAEGEGKPPSQDTRRERELEEAIVDLRNAQEELRRRWKYLAEAQRLSHSGTFGWKVRSGELVWSDETYRILGFARETNPTFDLVFDRIHPEDRDRLEELRDRATQNGMDLDLEHRILLPDGAIKYVHVVAHAGRDYSGNLEYMGVVTDITERKRADVERQFLSRKLQESKVGFEEAQRVAHIGHYHWDLIANRVTWSDELYRIYGLTPQEGPIDMAMVSEMIHPDDRDRVFRAAEESARSGVHSEAEHRVVRPNGEVRTVQGLGTVKKDASGRAFEMFGTVQDITERKRAEEALQRTELDLREVTRELRMERAYFTDAQRMAHIGSWVYNFLTHKLLHSSDENARLYGFDPTQGPISAQRFFDTQHAEDAPWVNATLERAVREGTDFYLDEYRIHHTDGSIRYLRAIGHRNASGEPGEYVGVTMDITERKHAEEALRRTEVDLREVTRELRREQAYLAEAQSLTHIGSWATNFRTEQMFHLSDEVYRLHGFDPNQGPSVLQRFWDTVHPEDEPTVRATLENAIRTGTDYDIPEFRVCHSDGSVRFLRTIGHHNRSGELGEYVGITMDITERKRADEERERLRQLEADLAHINRINMMGELAAALAHEIKQPIAASITSASACLRWLAHDPPDIERACAAATRMKEDGNRAADVINHLRSFYKKDTTLQCEIVDVKDIIREIATLLTSEANSNSITILFELDEEIPVVLADRVQLQQVLMNLMLNAIEAMKEAGGTLTIRAGVNPEGKLLISISDTGVGLPADNVERIFDAFHTTKPQGTGMGLAISRSIVESLGGRIWATTHQERGAAFHFTIPVEVEASK